jgi:putative adenylate-forming enzyme
MISYAEVLEDFVKADLEKIFNTKVVQIYKCTEGAIAMPCKHGNLHINEDILYVETLNDDGSPCLEGETCSRLLITDLVKHTLPIIRYELNDIVTLDTQKCKCGSSFRVIKQIQGRKDDMLIGQKADGSVEYIMPDFFARGIISLSDDIIDYQVFQDAINKLRIILKLNEKASEDQITEKCDEVIARIFAKFNCLKPEIEYIKGELIPNANSGKLIRIHRNFIY